MVVLDVPLAEKLVADVIDGCPDGIPVASIVMRSGGTTIASKHNTRMGRFTQLREVCVLAVMAREDILEVPQDWVEKQPQAMAEAPELVGAALLIYVKSGTPTCPEFGLMGVIGLFGIPSEEAAQLLRTVLVNRGFSTTSDLPKPTPKADAQD